jgi:deoxyribonuclease V
MMPELLNDHYSTEEAKDLQLKYQSMIQKISPPKLDVRDLGTIKLIAGVDISFFSKAKQEYGIACAVLWNLKEKEVIEKAFALGKINFPYTAGYLGFRECKLLAKALSKLKNQYDMVMCDGHGKIHPRRFGEAVQLGIALDISTMGVAKSPFVGFSEWVSIERRKGNKTPVWAKNPQEVELAEQEVLGYAMCVRDNSKPVFISEGYKVNIDLALKIALQTSDEHHRLPKPLFLADSYSRQKVRDRK